MTVKAKSLQQAGAIGMVVYTWGGFYGPGYPNVKKLSYDTQMPAIAVSRETGELIKKVIKSETVEINITPSNENPWRSLVQGPAGVLVQIYLELFGFISIVAALLKLRSFIKVTGFSFTVPQTCLVVEIIAVTSKLIFLYFHLFIL